MMDDQKKAKINIFSFGKQNEIHELEKFQAHGVEIEIVDSFDDASVIILSTDVPDFNAVSMEAIHTNKKIYYLSSKPDEWNIENLLIKKSAKNIIGIGKNTVPELHKCLIKDYFNGQWGIDKVLDEDAMIHAEQIVHSKEVNATYEKLIDEFDLGGFFNSPKDYLRIIANELASNAFYHAQANDEVERQESIFLTKESAIEIKIGLDSNRIALSVKDNIGKLNFELIRSSIWRSFQEKKPLDTQRNKGAGLGLYMVYNYSNQLIFNILPKSKTEIISVIDLNKRFLNYKKTITSIHINEEG